MYISAKNLKNHCIFDIPNSWHTTKMSKPMIYAQPFSHENSQADGRDAKHRITDNDCTMDVAILVANDK